MWQMKNVLYHGAPSSSRQTSLREDMPSTVAVETFFREWIGHELDLPVPPLGSQPVYVLSGDDVGKMKDLAREVRE